MKTNDANFILNTASADAAQDGDVAALIDFARRHRRLFVLTGAGVSTESGIPAYRDASGVWRQRQPVRYQDFVACPLARKRYWARSMLGWPRFAGAEYNSAHRALTRLQRAGRVQQLVTQNVDGLHQRAGSIDVIDLHGRLDRVGCLSCKHQLPRRDLQHWLSRHNPDFLARAGRSVAAPDGDAQLDDEAGLQDFRVPACPRCQGLLKPAVVFFGENVPRLRVERALRQLDAADAVLIVGSSLTVYSGYRFCRAASAAGKAMAAVNLGVTRADRELSLKVHGRCGQVLDELAATLA